METTNNSVKLVRYRNLSWSWWWIVFHYSFMHGSVFCQRGVSGYLLCCGQHERMVQRHDELGARHSADGSRGDGSAADVRFGRAGTAVIRLFMILAAINRRHHPGGQPTEPPRQASRARTSEKLAGNASSPVGGRPGTGALRRPPRNLVLAQQPRRRLRGARMPKISFTAVAAVTVKPEADPSSAA